MSKKENFVFYADWVDIIKAYDATNPELAGNLAKQIIYYGVTNEMTTDDPIVVGTVNSMCAALITKSKNRHREYKIIFCVNVYPDFQKIKKQLIF